MCGVRSAGLPTQTHTNGETLVRNLKELVLLQIDIPQHAEHAEDDQTKGQTKKIGKGSVSDDEHACRAKPPKSAPGRLGMGRARGRGRSGGTYRRNRPNVCHAGGIKKDIDKCADH